MVLERQIDVLGKINELARLCDDTQLSVVTAQHPERTPRVLLTSPRHRGAAGPGCWREEACGRAAKIISIYRAPGIEMDEVLGRLC